MILLLDFDGVLHPEGEGHLPKDGTDFCFLPRLEALLREFPHVRIVISSMWRERYSLDELRAFFSPDIAARIIGATPPPRRDNAGYAHARREGEICEWLAANGGIDQPWVALDDAEWQFDRHIDHLVPCGSFIGFDGEACAALRVHLERSLR